MFAHSQSTQTFHRRVNDSADQMSLPDLFREEEGKLLRFAYGICRRRTLAEDVVQEAFLSLHENIASVENPRAWVYRCVRNLSLNAKRKASREQVGIENHHEKADGEAPSDELERLEAAGLLQMEMAGLGERDRKLLKMKYFEDKSYREIADELEMTVGNVGSCLHHLLKGLAATLRRSGIGNDETQG